MIQVSTQKEQKTKVNKRIEEMKEDLYLLSIFWQTENHPSFSFFDVGQSERQEQIIYKSLYLTEVSTKYHGLNIVDKQTQ